ncbi:hypothetical protein [Streptomyces sp. NPDC018031]|uniref:hypothetical protein n=1 Tax=Streptomyces sp. NPDC018031 TaxID=3365033 RepID=UPI00379F5642
MRITAPLAAATFAVLSLSLTGCGDGDGDSAASGPSATSARPTATASKSPSTGPDRAQGTKSPSARPTQSRASAPARTTAPAPTRTSTPPRTRTTAPAAPPTGSGSRSGVQGTWYFSLRAPDGGIPVMTVSGGSFTIAHGDRSVTGTIDAALNVRADFQGQVNTGKATLGNGGQSLTFTWNDGTPPDRFSRTKPA